MRSYLYDPDQTIRHQAALEDLITDPEYEVMSSACWTLGELKVTSALGALRRIKSDDHYVKEAVQQAIKKVTGITDPPYLAVIFAS